MLIASLSRELQGGEGPMVRALREAGVEVAHVKYDQQRPDLSKFDSLLGSVLLEASKSLYAQSVERLQDAGAEAGPGGAAAAADAALRATAALSVAVDEVLAVEQGARDVAARSAAQLQAGARLEAGDGDGAAADAAAVPLVPSTAPSRQASSSSAAGGSSPAAPRRQYSAPTSLPSRQGSAASDVLDERTARHLDLEDVLRGGLYTAPPQPKGDTSGRARSRP